MRRILCDSPGPGQALAIEGIRMSQAIRGRGSSVEVRRVPGHARVEGNETADLCASEAATRSRRNQPSKGEARVLSLAVLKVEGTMKANKMWRGEIIRRKEGKRTFSCPKEGKRPRIRRDIGNAPKGIASRFYQLASGHAWLAPFLKERFGWVDSDTCWWCGSGRQTRQHCFKECITWKDEIKTLWREMGEASKAGSTRGKVKMYIKGKRVLGTDCGEVERPQETPPSGNCCQMKGFQKRCCLL